MQALQKIGVTLEMIKWDHSIFALPFALTVAMLAASGWLASIRFSGSEARSSGDALHEVRGAARQPSLWPCLKLSCQQG